jgi:hypothetical protein
MREKLAEAQHYIWSHWMHYLFGVSTENLDGSITIPQDKVARWKRLAATSYTNLTEDEKKSDREQADYVINEIGLHSISSPKQV